MQASLVCLSNPPSGAYPMMDQAFIAAAAAIAPALPPESSVSMTIQKDGHFQVLLHRCGPWMREQGAEFGDWYAFSEGEGTCQRNLWMKVGDLMVQGVETNLEAEMTLTECRASNAA